MPDVDIVIDDNPIICSNLEATTDLEDEDRTRVFAPYYPAVESQHKEGVLLVKNEVSNLKKEDFSK